MAAKRELKFAAMVHEAQALLPRVDWDAVAPRDATVLRGLVAFLASAVQIDAARELYVHYALVRAMRELTAREIETTQPSTLQDDLTAAGTISGASEHAGTTYAAAIRDQADYLRYIVRQMWEDAFSSSYVALPAALEIEIAMHQTPPDCTDTSFPHASVHLLHHSEHFDIWCPPPALPDWTCAACTFVNKSHLTICGMCSAAAPSVASPRGGELHFPLTT